MAESADDQVGLRAGHHQHTLPRAGPSHDADSSSGAIDPPIKRKRFQAFDRIVHKIFRRKSKRGDYRGAVSTSDVDVGSSKSTRGKSRSTSELAIVECRSSSSSTAAACSRKSRTLGSERATTSALSLSHDSVFAPDENDREDDDADRASSSDRHNPRKLLHFSRRRFSVKGMKEELMNKLRARRDQSVDYDEDDDPGLPHSPSSVNTSPTTVQVLGHGLLDERARAKKGSKLRSSDNSLLSMGSSETDNEMEIGGGVGLKLMIFDRRPNADPELDLGPTLLLNHRAAHHRIAIKPRRTHAVPCKHRRLQQVTGGSSSLPMTPEDAEETTAVFTGDSPSRSSDDFSTSSDSHHLHSRFQATPSATAIETEIVCEPSASSWATIEGAISIGNKSHAAECKLKHEIARYEQRMFESAESVDVDVEVVTTSCFGFGLGRARKTSCSSAATKDAKKPAEMSTSIRKPLIAVESKGNLSKVFGSRLSGRKKKIDECPATTDWSLSTKAQTSQQQGLSLDVSRPWSELQSSGRSLDVVQEPGGSKHSPQLRRHSCNVASVSHDIDVDVDDDDDDVSGHPSLSSIEGFVPGTSSSSSHVWASLEAKRKSVQHQLTKEDIDELESFLPCSRRSLTIGASSSDVRPTRRPLRFSVGSAQEVLPLQLDGTAVDEAADAPNNNNESNSFGTMSSRAMDEKTRSSVVRLDVPWIEQGPAKVTVDDEDTQQIKGSSLVSSEHESIVASAPLPPAPLRRQKQSKASIGGADVEPELFKVFHRRSLKLKDVDVPVVTQHKKEAAAVSVDSPPTCEVVQDEVVSEDVDQNDNNKLEESCKLARAIDASAGGPATTQELVAPDNVRRKTSDDPHVEPSNEIDPFVSSSPPIIQTNSKSVATRSSKVLDLVRNFQKLQAT